jgi:hypothetical protein
MSKGALRVYGFASMCIPNGSRRVIRVWHPQVKNRWVTPLTLD